MPGVGRTSGARAKLLASYQPEAAPDQLRKMRALPEIVVVPIVVETLSVANPCLAALNVSPVVITWMECAAMPGKAALLVKIVTPFCTTLMEMLAVPVDLVV